MSQAPAGLQTVPRVSDSAGLGRGLRTCPSTWSTGGSAAAGPGHTLGGTLSTELLMGVFMNVEHQGHLGSNRESKNVFNAQINVDQRIKLELFVSPAGDWYLPLAHTLR